MLINGKNSNKPFKLNASTLSEPGLLWIVSFALLSPNLTAQTDTGSSVSILEEMIVTARNREENLQDVPLAITAFDEEAMKRKNIENLDDVARFTSGLSFEDFSGGFATPVIRGQSQISVTARESNVSTFFDNIYMPRSWAIDLGTASMQRIEVVKGPQSARYGRNAFAGAINYIPYKAQILDQQFSAELSATAGSDERFDAGIKANLTVSDQFAIAATYSWSDFDGTWQNDHPLAGTDLGGTEGNIGGWDGNTSHSISILAAPTEALDIELGYYSFEMENEARAAQSIGQTAGTLNCGSLRFGSPTLFCGQLPQPTETAAVDPRSHGVHSDTELLTLFANYSINDNLDINYRYGNIDGTVNISNNSEVNQIDCGGFIPGTCVFQNTPVGGIDYDSHEIRLVYNNDSLQFEIGAFFSEGEDRIEFPLFLAPPALDAATTVPISALDPFLVLRNESTDTDVTAFFGAVQWTSEDGGLRLGAELRYSETDIATSDLRGPTPVVQNATFDNVTPRLTAEYNLNDNSLIYAAIAQGAKAGGFNASATNASDRVFDEESNWTYEIGSKNVLADGSLILNAALFYTDWADVQVNSPDAGAVDPLGAPSVILNLGEAEIFGFELDAYLQATENLSFEAAFSYSDPQYKGGTLDQRFAQTGMTRSGFFIPASCDDVVCPSNGDISGNQLERTPETKLSLGAQYEGDLGWREGSYYVRADLSWQESFFALPVNLAEIEDRLLIGARGAMTFDNFEISIWGRNLTDERYVANSFVVVSTGGNGYQMFFGDRRTFGLTGTYNF